MRRATKIAPRNTANTRRAPRESRLLTCSAVQGLLGYVRQPRVRREPSRKARLPLLTTLLSPATHSHALRHRSTRALSGRDGPQAEPGAASQPSRAAAAELRRGESGGGRVGGAGSRRRDVGPGVNGRNEGVKGPANVPHAGIRRVVPLLQVNIQKEFGCLYGQFQNS